MSDPYDWQGPDCALEDMSDADWLRHEARANFITEDIERADRIAAEIDRLRSQIASPAFDEAVRLAAQACNDVRLALPSPREPERAAIDAAEAAVYLLKSMARGL